LEEIHDPHVSWVVNGSIQTASFRLSLLRNGCGSCGAIRMKVLLDSKQRPAILFFSAFTGWAGHSGMGIPGCQKN
jgi:hypothetical protein